MKGDNISRSNLLDELQASCMPIDVPGLSGVTGDETTIRDIICNAPSVALLKEREAVKPGVGIIHYEDGSNSYFPKCPIDETMLMEGDNYCPHCGKKVKWDDYRPDHLRIEL